MLRALGSGASGLNAQQLKVDITANNLANINTTGFKKSSSEFSELVSQELLKSGFPVAESDNQVMLAGGVRVSDVIRDYTQGGLVETGMPLDLAIEGEGFFKVLLPSGEECYTRDGSFTLDRESYIVTAGGARLEGIRLAPGAEQIKVLLDGTVQSVSAHETTTVGQIQLYQFSTPEGLLNTGANLYAFNGTAADIVTGNPASEGFGKVRQGYLERANVSLGEEMSNLIVAQRAYSFNNRIVRTADEMWGMANSLRK